MKSIKPIISAVAFVAVVASSASSAYAATNASVNLSGSQTVTQGNTFSVGVNVSGADNVYGVTTQVAYDASQLEFLGGSCGGSFGSQIPESGSKLSCTVTPGAAGVSGSASAGSFTFRSVTTGTASISTTAGTIVAGGSGDQWNGVSSSVSIQSNAQVAAPAPVASTPRASSGTGSTTTSSTAAASTPTTDTPATTDEQAAVEQKTEAAKPKQIAVQNAKANAQTTADTTVSPLTWVLVAGLILASAGYLLRERATAVYHKYKK